MIISSVELDNFCISIPSNDVPVQLPTSYIIYFTFFSEEGPSLETSEQSPKSATYKIII